MSAANSLCPMSVNAHKTDPRITKETIFESMSSEDSDSDSLASIGKYDSFYDNWFYLFLKQFLQLKGIFFIYSDCWEKCSKSYSTF